MFGRTSAMGRKAEGGGAQGLAAPHTGWTPPTLVLLMTPLLFLTPLIFLYSVQVWEDRCLTLQVNPGARNVGRKCENVITKSTEPHVGMFL